MIDYLNCELQKPRYLLTHNQTFSWNEFSRSSLNLWCSDASYIHIKFIRELFTVDFQITFTLCKTNTHFFGIKYKQFMQNIQWTKFNSLLRFTAIFIDYFYIFRSLLVSMFSTWNFLSNFFFETCLHPFFRTFNVIFAAHSGKLLVVCYLYVIKRNFNTNLVKEEKK